MKLHKILGYVLVAVISCLVVSSCGDDKNDDPIPVANLTVDDLVGAWYDFEDEFYFVLDSDLSGRAVYLDDNEYDGEDELSWVLYSGKLTIKINSKSESFVISRCSQSSLMLVNSEDDVFNFVKVKESQVPGKPAPDPDKVTGYQTDGEDGYIRPASVVDMGFPADDGSKLYWASATLGAQSPLMSGDFFTWGRTTVKNPGSFPAEVSATEYDFARVKLGGKWRMPTWNEFKKLLDSDYCRNVVSVENGRWFVKFISKINNNELFFPLPGYKYNGSIQGENTYGRYLSGTPGASSSKCKMVWMSKFGPSGEEELANSWGYSVRPVYSE